MGNLRDFFIHLETSLSAGVPLGRTLHLLGENVSGWKLKSSVARMSKEVENGRSFSEAMEKAGKPFTKMQISFIKFGEQTGTLPTVCGNLAEYADKEMNLERDLLSSLAYPLFLLFIAMIMAPIIKTIMDQNSVWSASYGVVQAVILYFIVLGMLYGLYLLLNTGTALSILIHIPFVGTIIKKLSLCRFTRSLGVGLEAGVAIGQCLETSIKVTGNPWLEKELAGLRKSIKAGRPFAEGIKTIKILPGTMKEMIAVGEQSGKLAEMLKKTSDYFEEDARQKIKIASKIMPILFFLPVAIIVAYIIISMGSGIFSNLTSIK
jgi:type II secretory pathway component PulF